MKPVKTSQIQKTTLNVVKKILAISIEQMNISNTYFERDNEIEIDFLNADERLSKRIFILKLLPEIAEIIDIHISNVEVSLFEHLFVQNSSDSYKKYMLLTRFIYYCNNTKNFTIKFSEVDDQPIGIILKNLHKI